ILKPCAIGVVLLFSTTIELFSNLLKYLFNCFSNDSTCLEFPPATTVILLLFKGLMKPFTLLLNANLRTLLPTDFVKSAPDMEYLLRAIGPSGSFGILILDTSLERHALYMKS